MKGQIYRYFFVKLIFLINMLFKKGDKAPKDFKNVLIIHNLLIGDVIVATPFIRNFKKNFPDSKIVMVVSKSGYEILKKCPYIEKFIVFDEKFNGFFDFIRQYRDLIIKIRECKIDLVIDFQMSFSYFTRVLIPILSGAKHRIGYKRGGYSGFLPTAEVDLLQQHVVLQYLSVLDLFGIKNRSMEVEVFFDKDDLKWTDNFYKENDITSTDFVVAVHPANKNPLKRWSGANFAELINILSIEYKFKIVIVGSEDDEEILKEILSKLKIKPILAYGKTSLTQHCALLSKADLLIGVDTCSVHIASALNLPSVVLYGPTDIFFWGAWNKENQICISKDTHCKPCVDTNYNLIMHHAECTQKENICLKDITVEEVLDKAKRFF